MSKDLRQTYKTSLSNHYKDCIRGSQFEILWASNMLKKSIRLGEPFFVDFWKRQKQMHEENINRYTHELINI